MKLKTIVLVATAFIIVSSVSIMTPSIAVGAGTISMDTKNTDIRELLSGIAKANGINLVLGTSIKGKVSISLNDVSPMEAMELILISNGFVLEKIGSSVVAGKPDEIKRFLPQSSRVIAMQHARAEELVKALSGMVDAGVGIKADARTNSMIITGPETSIQMLEQIVKLLDVELPAKPKAPMVTRIISLRYTQATALQQIMSGLTSPAGKVSMDGSTNSIVITDEPSTVDRLSEVVAQLDVETPFLAAERAKREAEAVPPPPPPELRTRVFSLNHIEASAAMVVLQEMLSPVGKIQTFLRHTEPLTPIRTSGSFGSTTVAPEKQKWSDTLIVTDVDEVIKNIEELINQLDTEALQVKIEAKVVELSLSDAMELGINWQATHSSSDSTLEADFPVNVFDSLTLDLGTFSEGDFEDITGRLQALETLGKANIMFNPSVITLDNEMSQMLVADRIPITTTYETELRATTRVEYINVGISLTVIPHVTEDGYIIMDVLPQVDSVKSWTEQNQPVIASRVAHTRVRVKDGDTFAIGGLIKEEQTDRKIGIPILSRIPLLGRLFSSTRTDNSKTDLIVFITPKIYKSDT